MFLVDKVLERIPIGAGPDLDEGFLDVFGSRLPTDFELDGFEKVRQVL